MPLNNWTSTVMEKMKLSLVLGTAVDVTVYRWRRDHFESVDIAKAVKADRARLFQADGKCFSEAVTAAIWLTHDQRCYSLS